MSDGDGESRRWIRARQRDPNSSMVGFDASLSPRLQDIGVDRLQVSITGRWRSSSENGWSLFENALHLPQVDWFNRPERPPNPNSASRNVGLSKRRNGSTISACTIALRRLNTSDGIVQIDLTLNPTRTLSHLLARYTGDHSSDDRVDLDLLDELRGLELTDFFRQTDEADVGRSLDGSDNVLPPTRQVREQLGDDFWSTFLPLFVDRVRHLCVALLSEYPSVETDEQIDRITLPDGMVMVDWSEVKVPQIECYFERYHRDAITAVRRGGWAVLATDHTSAIQTYADQISFSRDNDRFAIGMPLNDIYRLAIYAKLRDRIRFEVRRVGKGNYSGLPAHPSGSRLLDIIEHERARALNASNWQNLGELLAGPDRPQIQDLAHMIEQVGLAVNGDADVMTAILGALLIDGSVSENTAPRDVIRRLSDGGIIERSRIRHRDINNRVTRYILTAPYREVHALLTDPITQRREQ